MAFFTSVDVIEGPLSSLLSGLVSLSSAYHNKLNIIIYSIICLKSVNVRRMQFAILAQSPREMALTDRILPRYFLSRVRVSIRHRIFLYAKKPETSHPLTDRPGREIFFPEEFRPSHYLVW